MKLLIILLFISFQSLSNDQIHPIQVVNFINPEQFNLVKLNIEESHKLNNVEKQGFLEIIETGNYLINWINEINKNRSTDQKIKLTSKQSGGIPYSSPMVTSKTLLIERYQTLISQNNFVSETLRSKILPFPNLNQIDDSDFIKFAIPFEKLTNHTIRFSTQLKNLSHYIGLKMYDVRGYLFFKEEPKRADQLNLFNQLNKTEQENFRFYLINLCMSSELSEKECIQIFEKNKKYNTLYSMYQKHLKDGESFYNLFFRVTNPRSDVYFQDEATLISNFIKTNPKIDLWLQTAVESAWKSDTFKLKLHFFNDNSSKTDFPHITFQKNVWAHVNEVGGNIITMDPSLDLFEERMISTIAHEYGHILGFVDCYLEFFDTNLQAMIYYELDSKNIMCSQSGSFLPIHQQLLKTKYDTNNEETSWK